jgi:hypothetical protein
MSLSHLAGLEQDFRDFHLRFTAKLVHGSGSDLCARLGETPAITKWTGRRFVAFPSRIAGLAGRARHCHSQIADGSL